VRASRFVSGMLLMALSACALAAGDASVAWLRDGELQTRLAAPPKQVPVGSLWKLFTYAHLVDSNANEAPYVCTRATRKADDPEHYCCAPGESIGRDAALARSCGAYFEPARLGIAAEAASRRLQPGSTLPMRELLEALDALSPAAKAAARRALLDVSLNGYGRDAWPVLGTGLRYKTYTWAHPSKPGASYGGAAGWLADGTPFWFGASGSSRSALRSHAVALAQALPLARTDHAMQSCVDVDFFERYPVRVVLRDGGGEEAGAPVAPGPLQGRYRVGFDNGNWLRIAPRGELQLAATPKGPRITGRVTLNEYVARVIDREAGTADTEAARAFAVAARSYLLQNGRFESGCWRIADASRTQRVSPNPASAKALAVAQFTDELVLQGAPVRYHRDRPAVNRLAWTDAVARSREGLRFDAILAQAYPAAEIASLNGREECRRMDDAETWLARAAGDWRRKLRGEPGFEPIAETVRVCALAEGHPYADQARLRIYARDWKSREGRLTLAHEYLHLAFRFHPNGADEAYIERLARRLLEG